MHHWRTIRKDFSINATGTTGYTRAKKNPRFTHFAKMTQNELQI